MLTIRERIGQASYKIATQIPIDGIIGCLAGYSYAKLANLPAATVTRAYVIWIVVRNVLMTLIFTMIEGERYANGIKGGTIIILNAAVLYDLRQKKLMGDKLMLFYLASIVVSLLAKLLKWEKAWQEIKDFYCEDHTYPYQVEIIKANDLNDFADEIQ